MAKIKFTADSTCDLPAYLLEELEVSTMPLMVTLGDSHYYDGVDITPDDIYTYVEKTGVLPKTAARSPEEYEEFFHKYLEEGYDAVIHFNLSSEISASYQNAHIASKKFNSVYAVDSRQLSTGTSVLMFYADGLRKQGADFESIIESVEARKNCVQTSFVVEKLDYLHKGGRCSGLQRFGANLLKLRPYIQMRNGTLGIGGKYKGGMKLSLLRYIGDLAQWFPNYEKESAAFITHSGCTPDIVQAVTQEVHKLFGFQKVYETVAGSTITSHCGKGTLGLLFLNAEPIV